MKETAYFFSFDLITDLLESFAKIFESRLNAPYSTFYNPISKEGSRAYRSAKKSKRIWVFTRIFLTLILEWIGDLLYYLFPMFHSLLTEFSSYDEKDIYTSDSSVYDYVVNCIRSLSR